MFPNARMVLLAPMRRAYESKVDLISKFVIIERRIMNFPRQILTLTTLVTEFLTATETWKKKKMFTIFSIRSLDKSHKEESG